MQEKGKCAKKLFLCHHCRMRLLTEKYKDKEFGTIGCYDRVLIMGTLPRFCYPEGMTSYLKYHNVRIFDYPKFAQHYRDLICKNAEELAHNHGVEINYIHKQEIRKEELVKAELRRLQKRGESPEGLFYIISALESCSVYRPWHDKKSGKTFLKRGRSQCLHYYFYVMDKNFGLCHIRVPTWLPCRLQICFNGHNWLAAQLSQERVDYHMGDNAFLYISDVEKAQNISDSFSVKSLHQFMDRLSEIFCPVVKACDRKYHWSVMQVEYATDIIFRQQTDLKGIYEHLVRTAVHTVKPERIATFLGRKLMGQFKGEVGNNYKVRKEGICIKHTMGVVSIKMYDKFQKALRIETTSTDISFFKHYRKVEHKDGTTSKKFTSMKKNIYSLEPLIKLMKASNRRYLEFISTIEDRSSGTRRLRKVTQRVEEKSRGYKGFNFFDDTDMKIIQIISRGEFNISGFRNKDLRNYFSDKSTAQISRILKRLKLHGIIKKARNTYKYYLTILGKQVALTAMKIKESVLIPAMNY